MKPLEESTREDIETGLDQIQQKMMEVADTNPDLIVDIDELVKEIRSNLMLLYTITK